MILWINGCDDVSRRRVDDVGASWGWWEEKDSGSAGHGGECNGKGRRDERAKGRRIYEESKSMNSCFCKKNFFQCFSDTMAVKCHWGWKISLVTRL
jgi:hypothetical protein